MANLTLSTFSSFILLSCLIVGISLATSCRRPSNAQGLVNSQAPDFELQDETGAWRSLAELRGKKVVLYFYPKDETPGCTAQACSFRDAAALYAENGIVILGINYESPKSHAAFKEHHHLSFSLLSDPTGAVAKAYKATSMLYFVPRRITILINEQGKIIKRLEDIDVANHAGDVLKAFAEE